MNSDMEMSAAADGIERDAVTTDGLVVHIRHARPGDLDQIRRFHDTELGDTSAYYRFFGLRPQLTTELLSSWAEADGVANATLLAFHEGVVVATGLYRAVDAERVDVALAVADRLQHQGIATLLLEDLAVLARRAGYRTLIAETMPGNANATSVIGHAGFTTSTSFENGVLDVEMALGSGQKLIRNADQRDRHAVAMSIKPILCPHHVAVIGASTTRDAPGNVVVRNLQRAFPGRISVVHPSATEVEGAVARPRIGDLPPVDLAVIAVPATAVPDLVDQCGNAGVHALVILSAGFTETSPTGAALQVEILRLARYHGMRLIGPNCFGVANPSVGLDATFGVRPIPAGTIAFASQSGGLGIALLAEAAQRGLGISSFVSLGNKADVSSNDLLCYWADDPQTKVIALYLESFGNPRKFARLARSISPHTPIVALKGGRTEAGRRGARSHTAALTTSESITDALLRHGGVIRARTMDELIDVTSVLDTQPLPTGGRVAVIGNAGGPLILAADAAEASGLEVPELSEDLQNQIRSMVPDAAATANPVDLLSTVTPEQLREVVGVVARSGQVDAVLVTTVPVGRPTTLDSTPMSRWPTTEVPIIVAEIASARQAAAGEFNSPERAVHALSTVVEYAEWRRNVLADEADPSFEPHLHESDEQTDALVTALPPDSTSEWLDPVSAFGVLAAIGVAVPPWRVVHQAEELAAAIDVVGLPLVLKADVASVLHKSDAGAVVLGVQTSEEAAKAFAGLQNRFGDQLRGVLVQHQQPPGIELIVGVNRLDPFGPLLVVGAGGTDAELLGDSLVLIAPATRRDIEEALDRLHLGPRLHPHPGRPPIDRDALVETIHAVGVFADRNPAVVEMDLNPVLVSPTGAVAVDVRIRRGARSDLVVPLRGMRPSPVR